MSILKKPFLFTITIILLLSVSIFANTPTKDIYKKEDISFVFHHNKPLKKLTLKTFESDYTVEIFDTEGNTIKVYKIAKNTRLEVSTADIKPGNYFLRYVGNSPKNNSVEKLSIE